MKLQDTIRLFMSKLVPLVVVYNALDLLETTTSIVKTIHNYNEQPQKGYTVVWDCIRGLTVEECAERNWAMTTLGADGSQCTSPIGALERVEFMLDQSREQGVHHAGAFVFYMADILLHAQNPDRDSFAQYLILLRDKLTDSQSMIVLVGIDFDIPASLKEHIALVSADLPDDETYTSYVNDVQTAYETGMKRAGKEDAIKVPDEAEVMRLRDTIRGQTTFSAKQSLYLSISLDDGLSRDRLQERAIHAINSTKGLSVISGDGRGFEAIGGMHSIKRFSKQIVDSGRINIRVVCFLDEIN